MKHKPSVRPARRADVAAVAAVARARTESAGWPPAALEEEIERDGSLFFVSEGAAGVLGYLIARIAPDEAHIVDIAAREDRRGAGRALLDALFETARSLRLTRVTLEVGARNVRAQNFYTAAGFRVVGRRPKFYNDGSDAVLMDRNLP